MANREGGNIYVIPQFADQGELEKLEISAPVIGMADAYDDIVYAVIGKKWITIRIHRS